jgi:hypothetical protein
VKVYGGATLGANTFTGAQGLPAGSESLPSLYFGGDTTTGLYRGAANIIRVATSGVDRLAFYSGGIALGSTGLYAFSSGLVGSSIDTTLERAAAGRVASNGSFSTAAPAGGTAAAWKFGIAASVSPTSPNRTIELDVGGTIYYLHAKTTNN